RRRAAPGGPGAGTPARPHPRGEPGRAHRRRRAGRRTRRRRRPPARRGVAVPLTGRGRGVLALAVALIAAGLATGHFPVAGVGAAFAVVVGAETVAVLRPLAVSVARDVDPPVVRRHDRCTAHVRLRHHAPGPLVRLLATDHVDGHTTPVPLVRGADGGSRASYDVPTPRRGLVRVGPLRLERTGVFGMAHRV